MSLGNVNGKVYDWTDIKINLPYGEAILIQSINYKSSLAKDRIYGQGGKVQGWGRGNYEAEGSFTILREEFERLIEWAKGQGFSIHQIPPFEITVSYSDYGDNIRTDKLYKCLLQGEMGFDISQGDTSVTTDVSFYILGGISFDGKMDYDEPK